MNSLLIVAILSGLLALAFAFYLSGTINKVSEGTDRMKEISSFIHEGAMAFLMREYKTLIVFVLVLFAVLTFGINLLTGVCFLIGAAFSTLAGFFGMKVATKLEQLMLQENPECLELFLLLFQVEQLWVCAL